MYFFMPTISRIDIEDPRGKYFKQRNGQFKAKGCKATHISCI